MKKIFALILICVGLTMITGCDRNPHGGSAPVAIGASPTPTYIALSQDQQHTSLLGIWHQTQSGIPNAVLAGSVVNGKITITLTIGNTSGLYWQGTFPAPVLGVVVSTADENAMSDSMYASQSSSKTFTVSNGNIYFPFSMLGVTTTVELSKGV